MVLEYVPTNWDYFKLHIGVNVGKYSMDPLGMRISPVGGVERVLLFHINGIINGFLMDINGLLMDY